MDISRFNGLPSTSVSVHSYSRCWIHLIWGTLNREKLLNKEAAACLSRYLIEYADTKGVYMKINYVNADHVHALVDLPTNLSIEELIQLLKGSSSHWVNANNIVQGKLAWGERLRRFFSFGIQCHTGCRLHCRARGTSSGAHLRGRASGIHRAPWSALAGGEKPLKRLSLELDAWDTPASRPVLMRGSCAAVTDSRATLTSLENYFFIRSSTAAVIATIPVRIVGSGRGANLLECKLGSGDAPGFFDSAILVGSTAPT